MERQESLPEETETNGAVCPEKKTSARDRIDFLEWCAEYRRPMIANPDRKLVGRMPGT